MRPRAAEIRAITALLDQEWDNVDDLASTLISEVFGMAGKRDKWCVIMQDPRLGVFTYGPYDTENQARKAIGKSIVSPGPEPAKAIIRRIQEA
jgi:hypothetical protein